MRMPRVRGLARLTIVAGGIGLLWALGETVPPQSTTTTVNASRPAALLDWQLESEGLLGRTAIVRVEPLLDHSVVLDIREAGSGQEVVSYVGELEVGARPPVHVRNVFTGGGWLLHVESGGPLEWGIPKVSGMDVVFSGRGSTYISTSGSVCVMSLLNAEWEAQEAPWAEDVRPGDPIPFWYTARSLVVELACDVLMEVRTGDRTSLHAVFRLAG